MSQLRSLVRAARALERDLAQREAAVAEGLEQLHDPEVIRAAFLAGQQEERRRLMGLIDLQLEQLRGAGLNTILLRTLRQQLVDDTAA